MADLAAVDQHRFLFFATTPRKAIVCPWKTS